MTEALFLSYGTSLADWRRQGILERELGVHLSTDREQQGKVYVVAPDTAPGILVEPFEALSRPRWMPVLLYAFLSPLVHWRTLRTCTVFRGHNGRALWAPTLARLLFGGTFILRIGYLWSWDAIKRGCHGPKLWAILFSEWLACRVADTITVAAPWQGDYLRDIHGVQ